MNGPLGWLRGIRYSRDFSRHQAPAADPVWGDTTLDDAAWDEIADELGDDYATEAWACDDRECSQTTHTAPMAALEPEPYDDREDFYTALVPLPAEPDGFWTWQPHRATQTISLPPWDTEDLPGPAAADPQGSRAGEPAPRRRRRPWSGLLGRLDPRNFPGQVGRASDTGHLAGDAILTGEIVPAPADQPPAVINININIVNIDRPAKWLLDELARRDAEALADIARRDVEFAKARDALYAWSGHLELTAGAA